VHWENITLDLGKQTCGHGHGPHGYIMVHMGHGDPTPGWFTHCIRLRDHLQEDLADSIGVLPIPVEFPSNPLNDGFSLPS